MNSLDIALTGWETVAPSGIGAALFPGDAADASAIRPADFTEGEYPPDLDYRFAPYEAREFLGMKGTRTMDRTTALAVGTAKLLVGARPFGDDERERTGFVLGTSTGSIRSTADFTRETFVQERPFLVNPALFPNTVMNCAAGQCAIWFKARGINATIAGGRLSGFMSLQYAAMMLRRRYVDLLYAGAVEELCPQTAHAHAILTASGQRAVAPQGEGCAMFALERGADVRARGDDCATTLYALQCRRYFDEADLGTPAALEGVKQCIRDLQDGFKFGRDDIGFVSIGATSDAAMHQLEREAAEAVFGASRPVLVDVTAQVGETYSAAFSFKLAGLLAHPQFRSGGRSAFGLVLSATREGYVAAALVRR
ncbi:MAG: beta-ketoacyl synthase N-terminal-like domain-containing protein [Gammaproteobacteria bacterium]